MTWEVFRTEDYVHSQQQDMRTKKRLVKERPFIAGKISGKETKLTVHNITGENVGRHS